MLSQYEADNCALFTTNVGQAHASKNRSVDVMPCECSSSKSDGDWCLRGCYVPIDDHNRVKIRGVAADYINASHLSMGPGCSPYIVAQAPLLETIEDFWTMVWEYDIPVIAMLTAEIEGGTVVCHRYWPEGGGHVMKLGLLSLTLLSHQENSGCVIRDIRIKNTKSDEEKKVVHLQFTSWPEIGVPQSPNALADFVVSVESSYRESSPDPNHPLLIQCSHGSGRSGVFLVLHCAIRALQIGSEAVDVPEVVQGMRRQRMRLIEDKGQYTFCYRALLHFARMCLKEAEDAAGEITPLSPTLSKKPMQAKEVTSEADPLDSINAFWKVESGALVEDIQNKNASKTEEQKAEPVVEFDPPTATFLSHYLPVSSISSVKQHPQPAVPTPRQVSVSYGSGGTVVHMLGSAIPSVLSPHAMIASATSVSTTKLDETDIGSRDVSVAPHFQLLLAQKQKQIDMQTAQLVEQERIIQELQREVTEQRVQIAEQQKLLTQKQVAVDEQKRVISDMQQRLSEQKHMEQRLEQLTEMMLLQQKDQLEHRMEERQQRQHIQQQLQHQQARLIEEDRIKRQHKQPQQQPVQPLPLQNQKPDELQHKHILQELNPSPRQQQPNPQPVQQQPHSQSMQQQQPSVLQQQWPMQQQTQQPQVQTKQLQMQAQQPQMQAQQPQQQQVLSQGHKPQAMQLKQQQILDMQQRQQHPQQQQHQQIQHHQQQQQQQQQIQHQQQMQQQIQQRTQQQRQLEQQHQIQQQLQHRQQAMEQPQHRILTTSQGMQGSFQPSHPQFRELPHQPTAGRQPGSQVSMEQQSREQIQQWKQVPSLQGVVQTQSVVSQPGPLLPQGGMTPVQPFQYYQKQEPQVSPGVPQLPIPHTLAGKDHLPVGSHPQQGCSPGLMQNTQRIQQHIVPRVVQPLAPGQQTLGSTNMNPVQTPSSLTPGHMQAANMAMGMHPYVQK
jgi:protein tyrosine phosphatase